MNIDLTLDLVLWVSFLAFLILTIVFTWWMNRQMCATNNLGEIIMLGAIAVAWVWCFSQIFLWAVWRFT